MAQIDTAKADDVSDAADVLRLCVAFRRDGVAAHSGRLVALLRGARAAGCPAFVNTEESITISLACAHFLADVPLTPAEKWADAVGDVVLTHEPSGGAAAWPHAPAGALGVELTRALRGGDVAGFCARCGALRRAQERTKGVPEAALRGAWDAAAAALSAHGGAPAERTCAGLRAPGFAPPPCAPSAVAWLELSLAEPDAGAAPTASPPFELRVAPPLALAADAAQELRTIGRGDRKRPRAAAPPAAAAPAAAPRVVCVPFSRATHRQRWRCEAAAAAVDEVSVLRVASAAALTELLTPLGRAAAFGHVWRSVAEADGADAGGGGGSVQYSVELHGDGAQLRVLLAEGGRADGGALTELTFRAAEGAAAGWAAEAVPPDPAVADTAATALNQTHSLPVAVAAVVERHGRR